MNFKTIISAAVLAMISASTFAQDAPQYNFTTVKENPVTEKAELYYVAADNKKTVNDLDVESLVTPTYKTSTVQLRQ